MQEMSDLLGEYEAHREQYPTLEDFSPRLVTFFAKTVKNSQADLASKRPKVVSMIPANGAQDVDPGLTAIQVVFDRPMTDKNWAMVGSGPIIPRPVKAPILMPTQDLDRAGQAQAGLVLRVHAQL